MVIALSEEEKNLLCQIASDLESGNHLIRPRSDEYKEMYKKLMEALSKNQLEKTQWEVSIEDYFKSCFPD